jgi:hypothetical protein
LKKATLVVKGADERKLREFKAEAVVGVSSSLRLWRRLSSCG